MYSRSDLGVKEFINFLADFITFLENRNFIVFRISFSIEFVTTNDNSGAKSDWDFQISDLVKTLMELIFNLCGEFRWSPEGPVSQIHSTHLLVGAPGIFSDLLRFVQMLKRE